MTSRSIADEVRSRRQAMLNPAPDDFVVDSCSEAVAYFEAALRSPRTTREDLVATLEAIATAMDVGRVFEDSSRQAWEFYLAAAAIASGENTMVANAAHSLWSEMLRTMAKMDTPTALLALGLSRYVQLSMPEPSEFFVAHVLPFLRTQLSPESDSI